MFCQNWSTHGPRSLAARTTQSHPFLRRLPLSDTVNLTRSPIVTCPIWVLPQGEFCFFFKKSNPALISGSSPKPQRSRKLDTVDTPRAIAIGSTFGATRVRDKCESVQCDGTGQEWVDDTAIAK